MHCPLSYMFSCLIYIFNKIPQIYLYFITVITNLAAYASLLSYSSVDLKFNMCFTTQGIGRAVLLSGGFRERSLSLFTQVVGIMWFLGTVILMAPSLFWLPCRTIPSFQRPPPVLRSWHIPSIFKTNNGETSPSHTSESLLFLLSFHLIQGMKLSYRL